MDAEKAKWWTAQVQNDVLDACLQLHGGPGFMNEQLEGRARCDARVAGVRAASEEIMREPIGRDVGQ